MVGKNPILLDACSIRTVYKGVACFKGLALTQAAASSTSPAATARSAIFCGLFILTPPFFTYLAEYYKELLKAKNVIFGERVSGMVKRNVCTGPPKANPDTRIPG